MAEHPVIPGRGTMARYPYRSLRIGDWFEIPSTASKEGARGMAYAGARRNKIGVTVKSMPDGSNRVARVR